MKEKKDCRNKRIHWKRRTLVYGFLIFSFIYVFVHYNLLEFFTLKIVRLYLSKHYHVDLSVDKWDVSVFKGNVKGSDMYLSRSDIFFCRVPDFEFSLSVLELLEGKIDMAIRIKKY